MDVLATAWNKTAFLLVHVNTFELHTVLWATALASWRLSVVLDQHGARLREARLARTVAAVYSSFSLIAWLSGLFLV